MLFQQRDFFSASAILCSGVNILLLFFSWSLCLLLHIIMIFNFIVMHTREQMSEQARDCRVVRFMKTSSARIAISLENVAYHTILIANIRRNQRRIKKTSPVIENITGTNACTGTTPAETEVWRESGAERDRQIERETNGRQQKFRLCVCNCTDYSGENL